MASRSDSPSRMNAPINRHRNSDGQNIRYASSGNRVSATASCSPHEIVGNRNPTPRNVRPASAPTELPTTYAAKTSTGAIPLGKTWRRRIRLPREPIVREARTYPRDLPLITVERTRRVISGQANMTITNDTRTGPPPLNNVSTSKAPRIVGIENQISAHRE